MPPWNLILQLHRSNGRAVQLTCNLFAVPSIPRPCRILFYAGDAASNRFAKDAHDQMERLLSTQHNAILRDCPGTDLWGCRGWREPSCSQILVPIFAGRVDSSSALVLEDWQRRAGSRGIILPALLPNVAPHVAFGHCSPAISRLNAMGWNGDPSRLAAIVAQRALQLEKPGLFISYRRSDARNLVDQLHDQLVRCGFRVFLDRFSGTPGRYFPDELAQEMAEKAVLLVLESPGILASKWTLWEIAFAHRYRMGLISLQLPGGPSLSRIDQAARLPVFPNAQGMLDPTNLQHALTFVEKAHVVASLRRRAFYEGLVSAAASHAGGSVASLTDGVLEIRGRRGASTGVVLPSGRPGQLADIKTLALAHHGALPRLLLGQHRHLQVSAHADLEWLARNIPTELLGRYDGYRRVRNLC